MDVEKPFTDKEVLAWQADAPWKSPNKCPCYKCSHTVVTVFEGIKTENGES
jgi:hypothetical protein